MSPARRLAAALALAAAGCATPPAPLPAGVIAGLEQRFWICDYIGTRRGVLSAPDECHGIVTTLKNAKFRGDFEALLAWWRENKPAQFRRLDGILDL